MLEPDGLNPIQCVRATAIDLATQVLGETEHSLFDLCAFFEAFILHGADGTRAQFGPKPAVSLRML